MRNLAIVRRDNSCIVATDPFGRDDTLLPDRDISALLGPARAVGHKNFILTHYEIVRIETHRGQDGSIVDPNRRGVIHAVRTPVNCNGCHEFNAAVFLCADDKSCQRIVYS